MKRNSGKNSSWSTWWDRARPKASMLLRVLAQTSFARWIARRFWDLAPGNTSRAAKEGASNDAKSINYSPPPAQRELWDAVVRSISNLTDHEKREFDSHTDAILFHSAQPLHYIKHYKLKVWQRLLYPFHSTSFSRGMRLLATLPIGGKSAEELIQRIDDDLAYIEFAGKFLGHQLRYQARREIVLKRLPPWKIRSSFISPSIVCRGTQISASRVSGGVYWPFRICREVLLALAAWAVAIAAWETATRSCLTCNSLGLLYLSVFLTLFGYLAHIGGPERRQAERFLQTMKLIEFDDH